MHCGWHSCCWENRAHGYPYAQPPMWGPRPPRRPSREEEKEDLRDQLQALRAEIEEIERRMTALGE